MHDSFNEDEMRLLLSKFTEFSIDSLRGGHTEKLDTKEEFMLMCIMVFLDIDPESVVATMFNIGKKGNKNAPSE